MLGRTDPYGPNSVSCLTETDGTLDVGLMSFT